MVYCAEGENQLKKAWDRTLGNLNGFAKHSLLLKSVCSALDRCINSSITGFSKECVYQVICCQNNRSDAWFLGNNTEPHWLTLLPHTQESAFSLYRTIFLSAGKSINSFSILIAHNCSSWKIASHFKKMSIYWAAWGKMYAFINISCYFPFLKVHGSSLSLVSSTSSLYSTVSIDISEKSSACLCSCSLFMKMSILWGLGGLKLYHKKAGTFIFNFGITVMLF